MTGISDEWINRVCEADPLMTDDFDDEEPGGQVGPPLTAEEVGAAYARLARWQSVEAFRDDEKALRTRCTSSDFFLQPRLSFLRDAYVLAKFAAKVNADQVCLAHCGEQWPDGFVKIAGHTFNVEATSAHGWRKLGDEYRCPKGVQPDTVEDWIARAVSIPKYLDKAIGDKLNKYAGTTSAACWLVVYLNISEWGIRHAQIEQVIADTLSQHRSKFENISVLWKGKLYGAVGPLPSA